jgi:hypothetical protein
LEDGAKVEDFKYLSKGKIFLVPTLSITTLPEDEQMSKHGGEGSYNAIYSSREANKKMMKRKKKRKNEYKEKKRDKEIYV